MNAIQIRKATYNDLPQLLEFEQGIIAAERPFDPTLKQEKISYYDIEQMIASPEVAILVAAIKDQIVSSGYARITTAKPYLRHQNYGYLGFMFTLPQYRGQGINATIIEALKQWCSSQSINEIRLDVYDGNTSAIKAYEKVGFKKHLINMRMEI